MSKSKTIDTLIAGCAGGMAQVIAGQPFDMIKVRLQSASSLKTSKINLFDCLKNIVKHEGGPLALWRGSLSPLLSVGAAVALQFSVNEKTKSFIKKSTGSSKLDLSHYFGCGVVAGLANSIISIPTEHSKIKMQAQGAKASGLYSSSIDCIKKIGQTHGLRGLYKGGIPTMLREGLAFGIYFSFYEWFLDKMMKPGQVREQLSTSSVVLAGSMTGVACWLATYPIDIIKTRIQLDSFSNPLYKGMVDCFNKSYKAEGLKGLYRGFSPCALRAAPANGATFLAYEAAISFMGASRKRF